MKYFNIRHTLVSLIAILAFGLNAQPADLTSEERKMTIDSINDILGSTYVFPEVAEEMAALLDERLADGSYSMDDPNAFAQQLTADLQSISHDKHLRVSFAPEQVAQILEWEAREPDAEPSPEEEAERGFGNYGFQEVKLLEGNVGYLDLRGFSDTRHAGQTAVAAMNFLSNSSALIIDLRNNGGGSPSMIQLITSYLYADGENVHLNNFYWRPADETTQTWTLPYVPGKKLDGADVFVLTSQRTFSAAEEFTYNLKNLERATIVGETTGGGAHPGGTRIAGDRFLVWVPSGRAINPITETNWEGTGVTPHVEVPEQEALDKAHLLALEKLAEKEGPLQQRYAWYVPVLKAQVEPVAPAPEKWQTYAGKYGPRNITYKDGQLFYHRDANAPRPLIPLADDLFYMEEIPYFRLKIEYKDGQISGLRGLYDDGREDFSPLDKA